MVLVMTLSLSRTIPSPVPSLAVHGLAAVMAVIWRDRQQSRQVQLDLGTFGFVSSDLV